MNSTDNSLLDELLAGVRDRKDAFQVNKERKDARHALATKRAQGEAADREAQMRRDGFRVYSGDSR
jgi:hypothetical protein